MPDGYPSGDVNMATLSATIKRHDGTPIMFSELVYNISLHELVQRGRIVPWEIDRVPTNVDLDAVALRKDGLDFNEDALAEAINTDERHCVIIERHLQKWGDMQFIAFMPGVKAAERMAELCREVFNLAVFAITGQTPPETRKLMVEMLKAGYLHGLVNCKALTEGTDLPPAAVGWMAHPTRSAPFYKQMAGRVLRTWDMERWNRDYPELAWAGDEMGLQAHKQFAVLLDAIDICTRFTLASGASLDAPEEPEERDAGRKVNLGGSPKTSLKERREELKVGQWVEVDDALHKYLAPDGRVATIYAEEGGWWANLDEFGMRSGWWKKLLPAFSYANLMLGAATSGSRQKRLADRG